MSRAWEQDSKMAQKGDFAGRSSFATASPIYTALRQVLGICTRCGCAKSILFTRLARSARPTFIQIDFALPRCSVLDKK